MNPSPNPAKLVYICHPYSSQPEANAAVIRDLCRRCALDGHLPLAPQIYLPQFLDEVTERDVAMDLCRRLIGLADKLLVFGDPTRGMQSEIEEAHRLEVPVVHVVWGPQCSRPEAACLGAVLGEGST